MEESEWELSKENIQPLKQGRQPSILSKALRISTNVSSGTPAQSDSLVADGSTSSSATVRALILQQEKQEFEDSLKTCMQSSDPLSVYYRYIRWIEQTYPAGKEKEIRELVNKCLTSLKDQRWFDKYANDLRYLYVWLKFASFSKNMGSTTVYEFMRSNGHCVRLAGFYLQWVGELEASGHFEEAAKIFQSGIQMEAQPLPSLMAAYEEFQARYARRIMEQQKIKETEDDETRNVLGVLKGADSRRATAVPTTTPYMRHSRLEEVKCGKPSIVMENRRGGAFAIYDESQENVPSLKIPGTNPKPPATHIPSEKSYCKENVQDADIWTKAKIAQAPFVKKAATSNQKPSFAIYVDESAMPSISLADSTNRSQGKLDASSKSFKQFTADGGMFMCCMAKIYDGSTERSFEELRALRWKEKRINSASVKSTPAVRPKTPAATPFGSRPPLTPLVDSTTPAPSIKKAEPVVWNPVSSPPGNSSFTKNIYREAMAAFSNTLHLSSIGTAPEVEESQSIAMRSAATVPKRSIASSSGFAIYEDPGENRNDDPPPKVEADKENIDPKFNPAATTTEKKRRNVAGILCQSTEFAIYDENNKDNVILIEEEDEAPPTSFHASAGATASTTGNHTSFDFNESTVAGFHRFLAPNGTRAFSTPCHNLSRVQPLSLSSYKPLDFGDAEDTGTHPVVMISAPVQSENRVEEAEMQNGERAVGCLSTGGASRNPIGEQKLSTIAETSREYVSSSSSSNSTGTTASGSNVRRRLLSGTSGVTTMPSISEGDAVRNKLAFSTPFSDTVFVPMATSGDHMAEHARFQGTPYYDRVSANSSGQKSGAVRKLLLGDENDQVTENKGNAEAREVMQSINPWTENFVSYMLKHAKLDNYPNYHTFEESVPPMKAGYPVYLSGETYLIIGVAGQGAYAQVYKCNLENEDNSEFVLKVQKPSCPIEFYICQELQYRLKNSSLLSIVESGLTVFKDAYMFSDGSVLVGEYTPYGTLLDLVNLYGKMSSEKSPPEIIVAYLTADILRILEAVHSQYIIHGDVKPDNFLVLAAPPVDLEEVPTKVRTVRLIDWGRSIDMALVPPEVTFTGKAKTSGFNCCEMQDGRPWTYQADYYGLLGTVHVLAFGEYMTTYKVATTNRWRITKAFKRRWDDSLWREFFDAFLNVPDCWTLPSLSEWRKRFDEFVIASRATRPSTWTLEVKKMQDLLVELQRSLAKRKKLN